MASAGGRARVAPWARRFPLPHLLVAPACTWTASVVGRRVGAHFGQPDGLYRAEKRRRARAQTGGARFPCVIRGLGYRDPFCTVFEMCAAAVLLAPGCVRSALPAPHGLFSATPPVPASVPLFCTFPGRPPRPHWSHQSPLPHSMRPIRKRAAEGRRCRKRRQRRHLPVSRQSTGRRRPHV